MQCSNIDRATDIEISFPVSSLQEIINSGKLNYVGTATVLGTTGCSFYLKTVNDGTKVTMILSVCLQNITDKLSFHVASLVRKEITEVDLGTNVENDVESRVELENQKLKENHKSTMEGTFTPSFEPTSVCNIKSEVLQDVQSDNLVIKSEVCQDEPSDNLAIGANSLEPELAVTQDVPNLQSGVEPKTISANLVMTPSGLTLVPTLHPVQMTTPHNPLVQSTNTHSGQTFASLVSTSQPIEMAASHNPLVQTAKTYSDQTLVNHLPVSHPGQMTMLNIPLMQTARTCSDQTLVNFNHLPVSHPGQMTMLNTPLVQTAKTYSDQTLVNLLPVSHPGQMTMLNTPLVQTAKTRSDQTLLTLIPVSHPVQMTPAHTPLVQTAKTCSSRTLVSLEPASHLGQMTISHSPLIQTAKTTSDQTGNVLLTEKTKSAVPVAMYENMAFNKNVSYPSIKTEPEDSAMPSCVESVDDERSCVTEAGVKSPKINTSKTLEEHNLTGDIIRSNTSGMPHPEADNKEAKKRKLSDVEETTDTTGTLEKIIDSGNPEFNRMFRSDTTSASSKDSFNELMPALEKSDDPALPPLGNPSTPNKSSVQHKRKRFRSVNEETILKLEGMDQSLSTKKNTRWGMKILQDDRDELKNQAKVPEQVLAENTDLDPDQIVCCMQEIGSAGPSKEPQGKKTSLTGKSLPKEKKKTAGESQSIEAGSKKAKHKAEKTEDQDDDSGKADEDLTDAVMKQMAHETLQKKRKRSPPSSDMSEDEEEENVRVLSPLKSLKRDIPLNNLSPVRHIQSSVSRQSVGPITTPLGSTSRFDNNYASSAASEIYLESLGDEEDIQSSRNIKVDKMKQSNQSKPVDIEDRLSRIEKKQNRLEKELEKLKELEQETAKLKKKYKKLKSSIHCEPCESTKEEEKLYNNLTKSDLLRSIQYETDGSKMAKTLMLTAFSKEYIFGHSFNGQKANKNFPTAKEAMDGRTILAIKSILVEKLNESSVQINARLQNVQRVIRAQMRPPKN